MVVISSKIILIASVTGAVALALTTGGAPRRPAATPIEHTFDDRASGEAGANARAFTAPREDWEDIYKSAP
jgi:hypothetical protein